MFDRKGLIVIDKEVNNVTDDKMFEYKLEAGAEDMIDNEDVYEVYTAPTDFTAVKDYLEAKGLEFLNADIEFIPQSKIELTEEKLASFTKMMDMFDDNDDVQSVYHNVGNYEE